MFGDLDGQVSHVAELGYPDIASYLEPLMAHRHQDALLVVPSSIVATSDAMEAAGGYVDTTPVTPNDFAPIDGLDIPDRPYLLVDVDVGEDLMNVTPDDALATLTARGRSPLTIDEGVALFTHLPDVLVTHNAYSLLGSRCGDKRVTAIWNSKGRARLGWCWAGNPHTWLGSASCAARAT